MKPVLFGWEENEVVLSLSRHRPRSEYIQVFPNCVERNWQIRLTY